MNSNDELQSIIFNPKIFLGMYLLHSNDQKFYLTTRIQKAYFLFCKEVFEMICKKVFDKNVQLNLFSNDDFTPYNYGPYSKDLDLAITFYEDKNIIIVEENNNNNINNDIYNDENNIIDDDNWKDRTLSINKKFRTYKLNRKYINNFENSKNKISNIIKSNKNNDKLWWEEFKKFVDNMNSNDINRILKYVYEKYPSFTSKSIIKKEVNNE